MALKKALCNADLFIAANSKPTQRDSRANTSDIINYMISSPAILTLNNDFSFDHFAIIIDFLTNIRRSMPLHIRVKLHHKADWDSINSLLSKQLFYRIRFLILHLLITLILSIMRPPFLLTLL